MSRILLVDDETDFLDATARALGRRGFVVGLASDADEALEKLGREPYDVAVFDVRLPGMSGVDLFHEVRARHPRLPVILLTGHGQVHQAFETVRDGVFEYLAKPCSIDKLARVAERAVANNHEPQPPAAAQVQEVEIRVLLVDDDVGFQDPVALALRRRGMRVSTAVDPKVALEIVTNQEIDVAILDVGLDGLGLLERMKVARPALEIILVSGQPIMGDVVAGIRAGAFDFLTKPQSIDALTARVRDAWEAVGSRSPRKPRRG
jgi:DNA-binding NtrC family response regulator